MSLIWTVGKAGAPFLGESIVGPIGWGATAFEVARQGYNLYQRYHQHSSTDGVPSTADVFNPVKRSSPDTGGSITNRGGPEDPFFPKRPIVKRDRTFDPFPPITQVKTERKKRRNRWTAPSRRYRRQWRGW
uniref:Uncharacterized protein n=1 Tax=Acheta domesticus volvovirus TaxID=1291515 RepID=M1JPQ1_9VIRU|nr:hypothetical protein [Acheta domesticus volvovirus]AGJ03165.1 hypothetical protein [Acheta domesticus volvovirus]